MTEFVEKSADTCPNAKCDQCNSATQASNQAGNLLLIHRSHNVFFSLENLTIKRLASSPAVE